MTTPITQAAITARLDTLRDEILSDQDARSTLGRVELYHSELPRLLAIADLLDFEAESWAEGFAVRGSSGAWSWPDPRNEWAHVRHVRLTTAAADLRKFASRKPRLASTTP